MFSGIVEEVGVVLEVRDSDDGRWLKVRAAAVTSDMRKGESISVNGTCLTVIDFGSGWFCVEATWETLRRTTLGVLSTGSGVNLERALRLSDRIGGHLVSGHIDAVGKVVEASEEGFSRVITFAVDSQLAPFFVEKGSVAIEGVSLTVVDFPLAEAVSAGEFLFRVALIPHTLNVTTFGRLKPGDCVNIETDIVARYVARWLAPGQSRDINNVTQAVPFVLRQG